MTSNTESMTGRTGFRNVKCTVQAENEEKWRTRININARRRNGRDRRDSNENEREEYSGKTKKNIS